MKTINKWIVLDVEGSDKQPAALIKGGLDALMQLPQKDFGIIFVGRLGSIKPYIRKRKTKRKYGSVLHRCRFKYTTSVITAEIAAEEASKQEDSSLVEGLKLLAANEASAFISAASTAAVTYCSVKTLGCLDNITRPAISALLPTVNNGSVLLLDVGANADCRPRHLLKFAIMGLAFMRSVQQKKHPQVGLLNIGEEEKKGNSLARKSFDLLRKVLGGDFIGNVEGGDVIFGTAKRKDDTIQPFDVAVTDGHTGNVSVKFGESILRAVQQVIKLMPSWNKILLILGIFSVLTPPLLMLLFDPSYFLLGFVPSWIILLLSFIPAMRYIKKRFDRREFGGAPLLGINGCVMICHGRSGPKAIVSVIRQSLRFIGQRTNDRIQQEINDMVKNNLNQNNQNNNL